jgi:flagellar biosynthesis GTPase FlhF
MTATREETSQGLKSASETAGNPCAVCGKTLATASSLKRHLTQVHQLVADAATVPAPRTEALVAEPLAPLAAPAHVINTRAFAQQAPPSAPPAVGKKPLYKKKRFFIPVAAVAAVVLIGSLNPSPDTSKVSNTSTTKTTIQPAKTPGQRAAADKAAAETSAADKAADRAAAAKRAAADKAAAAKAAAERAAAAKAAAAKAAAEKAAAREAAAAKAAAARAAAAKEAAAKAAAGTVSQQNAVAKAADYLGFAAFSRSGLIKQLNFEGFSTSDATWGVDKQHADWNAQAAAKAKDYLDFTAFSRSGLIQQLEFEGFTASQASYGASQVGL